MEQKGYNLTCGEVIDNLLTLADAYEKASAGKAPNGFAFNPTDAAANMKAAVHFIGSFGQQMPRWIPVGERLPEGRETVLVSDGEWVTMAHVSGDEWYVIESAEGCGYWPFTRLPFWMPLPEPPEVE